MTEQENENKSNSKRDVGAAGISLYLVGGILTIIGCGLFDSRLVFIASGVYIAVLGVMMIFDSREKP